MNEEIKYNKEKFKSVLHYIISKCGNKDNVGRTVVYKLLYFSDFDFYEINEVSLTGEKYTCKPKGPVPNHFLKVKNELINENKIKEENIVISLNRKQYRYSSLKQANVSLLTEKELQTINNVIIKLAHMSANQISEYSHGDMPWKVASNGEELDYEYVFYRDPNYSLRIYNE
jgi:uncharacterized phage-associated protein